MPPCRSRSAPDKMPALPVGCGTTSLRTYKLRPIHCARYASSVANFKGPVCTCRPWAALPCLSRERILQNSRDFFAVARGAKTAPVSAHTAIWLEGDLAEKTQDGTAATSAPDGTRENRPSREASMASVSPSRRFISWPSPVLRAGGQKESRRRGQGQAALFRQYRREQDDVAVLHQEFDGFVHRGVKLTILCDAAGEGSVAASLGRQGPVGKCRVDNGCFYRTGLCFGPALPARVTS